MLTVNGFGGAPSTETVTPEACVASHQRRTKRRVREHGGDLVGGGGEALLGVQVHRGSSAGAVGGRAVAGTMVPARRVGSNAAHNGVRPCRLS